MGGRRRKRASGRRRSGAFLLPLLGGLAFVALVAVVRPWTLVPRHAPAPAALPLPTAPSPAEMLVRLRTVLHGEAEWEREGIGQPPEWRGKLRDGEALVHWNARVSGAIEGAGLQVRDGREELLDRPGGVTLQRLTLEVGTEQAVLAIVVVETRRSPYLPPTF